MKSWQSPVWRLFTEPVKMDLFWIENAQKHVKSCFYAGRRPYSHVKHVKNWCKRNLANFWDKPQWPGNSLDLNPIENLWGYLQGGLNKMDTTKSICDLKIQLESACSSIKPNYLQALIDGMPERIKSCIKLDGNYISK